MIGVLSFCLEDFVLVVRRGDVYNRAANLAATDVYDRESSVSR